MIITVSLRVRKSSYCIFYQNKQVKRLDVNGHHSNRVVDRAQFTNQTHKHPFLDIHELGWAYAPDDITTDDPRHAFDQFCAECGIDFAGTWEQLPNSPLDMDF